MLASAVIGLVDDESGLLYYINAEHPFVVLYRDGRASFIDKELQLWKLGVYQPDILPHINTFLLLPGDMVFNRLGR
jgi:serine phosphatase RsbU (regulator of sigma subunit)